MSTPPALLHTLACPCVFFALHTSRTNPEPAKTRTVLTLLGPPLPRLPPSSLSCFFFGQYIPLNGHQGFACSHDDSNIQNLNYSVEGSGGGGMHPQRDFQFAMTADNLQSFEMMNPASRCEFAKTTISIYICCCCCYYYCYDYY